MPTRLGRRVRARGRARRPRHLADQPAARDPTAGPGTILLGQELRYRRPVHPGDRLTATVEVTNVRADKPVDRAADLGRDRRRSFSTARRRSCSARWRDDEAGHRRVRRSTGGPIGPGHPVYVIAEVSANHGQHVRGRGRARPRRACRRRGRGQAADLHRRHDHDRQRRALLPAGHGSLWEGTTLYALYETAYTPWEWQPRLKALADELGMDCFSSPFDPTAVDFLMAMDVPAFKIASFELVDLPLIRPWRGPAGR